ncbi:MAG: GTPase HflX [Planctomycetes bacterium]|nr:GTPase HflX [Planctomycetota bacterium]
MRHSIRSNTPDDFRPRMSLPQPLREPTADGSDRKRERAVLVAVLVPNTSADLRDPLGELAALAESAGTVVVDSIVQKRTSLSPSYALGKGKLAELVERVEAHEADVVIFDNELTPRQIRGIEKAINRKVIDRAELILDIFASRARTREAQLQVELAQLEYTAPRLRGMWSHLERIAGAGGATAAGVVGGVGTRGPGERQIEIDRRIVKDRISFLKREIREIDRRKQREVRSRSDHFTVSLVGYTNSGKSTLMNKLTGAGRFVADRLFATLDTKTARWEFGDGHSALLSDTVGFIRDLPHHLVASFRATLEEAIHANLLLHLVDISSSEARRQMESVDEVLASLGCGKIPQITLLNKLDIADDTSMAEMLACHRPNVLRVSAVTGEGLDRLIAEVTRQMRPDSVDVTALIPHAEGKLLTEIGRLADVRARRYRADGVELDIRITPAHLSQLQGRYGKLSIVKRDGEAGDEFAPDVDA